MNIQSYIDTFTQHVENESKVREQSRSSLKAICLDAARKFLQDNIGPAFGTALIETGHAEHSNESGACTVLIDISFSHDDVKLKGGFSLSLLQKGDKLSLQGGNTPRLKFEDFYDADGNRHDVDFYIRRPLTDVELGDLFYRLVESVACKKRRLVRDEKSMRSNAIDFSRFSTIASADAAYTERVKAFPQYQTEIKAAFDIRVAEIDALRLEKEQEAQERARLQTIHDNISKALENYAAQAWTENPFIAVEIEYGAKVEYEDDASEENPIYTKTILTLSDVPDDAGYFTAYRNGEPYKYRPVHIIGYRIIKVNSVDSAPHEFKRYIDLSIDGEITRYSAMPPAGIFHIDPAFLIEKKQESSDEEI